MFEPQNDYIVLHLEKGLYENFLCFYCSVCARINSRTSDSEDGLNRKMF